METSNQQQTSNLPKMGRKVLMAQNAKKAIATDTNTKADTKVRRKCSEILKAARKERYMANGSKGRSCNDWLDGLLVKHFLTVAVPNGTKKALNVDAFTKCLVENGVEMTGKWADLPNSGQNGWIGRYRMNGRLKLEKAILERKGVLLIEGKSFKAPKDWKQSEGVLKRNPDYR